MTCWPSRTEIFSTNVSSCARITKGEIGSTFPLLLMEETMFSRDGTTAESFVTGWRPLSRKSKYANMAAARRKNRSRLRSLRSMILDISGFVRTASLPQGLQDKPSDPETCLYSSPLTAHIYSSKNKMQVKTVRR